MNAGHLIAQDNAFLEALHQIAAINICPIRYGLLPEKSGNPNFDMNLTVDHIGNIDVLINRC